MLTLLTYPRNAEVFSLSPFCVKAALLLNHAQAKWQRQDLRDPRKMPHQKLPVLRVGQELISDSANIRRYLEAEGAEFDPGLGKRERAQAHSLIRMAEETLYFFVVRDRWDNDAVWPTIRDNYFQEVPFLLRRPVTGAYGDRCIKGCSSRVLAVLVMLNAWRSLTATYRPSPIC